MVDCYNGVTRFGSFFCGENKLYSSTRAIDQTIKLSQVVDICYSIYRQSWVKTQPMKNISGNKMVRIEIILQSSLAFFAEQGYSRPIAVVQDGEPVTGGSTEGAMTLLRADCFIC